MNLDSLSYKMKNRENIIKEGISNFIINVFKSKQDEINECILNLYNDLKCDDLVNIFRSSISKDFYNKLYELKNELNLREIDLAFFQLQNINHIETEARLNDLISQIENVNNRIQYINDKTHYILNECNKNIEKMNVNFMITSTILNECGNNITFEHLDHANVF
jgi:hypothetical protein